MRPALLLVLATSACARPAPSEPTGDRSQPRAPPTRGLPTLDPNACGDYATRGDHGRKVKLYLEAVANLERSSIEVTGAVRAACLAMAGEVGMTETQLEMDELCAGVHDKLREGLRLSFRTGTAPKVAVTPAVCQVDRCTDPTVTVEADPKHILDNHRADQTVKALRVGLPKILAARARLAPMTVTAKELTATTGQVKAEGVSLVNKFNDRALCVAEQLAAAERVMRRIEVVLPRATSAGDAIAGVIRTSP